MEAPGIEPPARVVANGRKRTQAGGNGRRSAGLNGKMRPFATTIRPDATASVYQVYQAIVGSRGDVAAPTYVPQPPPLFAAFVSHHFDPPTTWRAAEVIGWWVYTDERAPAPFTAPVVVLEHDQRGVVVDPTDIFGSESDDVRVFRDGSEGQVFAKKNAGKSSAS